MRRLTEEERAGMRAKSPPGALYEVRDFGKAEYTCPANQINELLCDRAALLDSLDAAEAEVKEFMESIKIFAPSKDKTYATLFAKWLKSRRCESCKWWTLGQNNQNWGECAHGVAYENFSGGGVRGTFGCIHWEAKR